MSRFPQQGCLRRGFGHRPSAPLGYGALPVLAALLVLPVAARAQPQGGQVKQGDATISVGGSKTTIDQRSGKAIIDWQKFSLDAHESAVFNQPGANAIALNRVTGGDPSNILGAIRANGQVWLVNRNGVMFGKSATVDVQGLVARSFRPTTSPRARLARMHVSSACRPARTRISPTMRICSLPMMAIGNCGDWGVAADHGTAVIPPCW